jgi:metal-dependent hydrolase (beta-lactamase superfamily II)
MDNPQEYIALKKFQRQTFEKLLLCHCERSEAISLFNDNVRDCHVATLLAMTI